MEIVPGATIGGRYRVERRLGAGGVGEVWAGVALDDGSKVAIKNLLSFAKGHREHVTRFKREANFLSRIRSPNVARVVDFLWDETYGLVLVLELIEGEPLNLVLRSVRLSVEEAIDVAGNVLSGVVELHRQQIIHRDLKPGNIILQTLAGGKKHAVIVDFGISRFAGLDQDGEEITALTRADIAVGTMEYMAPEQILNSRSVTAAADIYAVGAMLYRAVAGHHVFGDLSDAELARHKMIVDPPPLETGRTDMLARGFEAIVMRMLQRKQNDRYQRAELVLADLTALRSGTFQAQAVSKLAAEIASNPAWPPPSSSPEAAPSTPLESAKIPQLPRSSQPSTSGPTPIWRDEPAPAPRHGGRTLVIVAALGLLGGALALGAFVLRQRALSEDTSSEVLPLSPVPDESSVAPGEVPPAEPVASVATVVSRTSAEPEVPDAGPAEAGVDSGRRLAPSTPRTVAKTAPLQSAAGPKAPPEVTSAGRPAASAVSDAAAVPAPLPIGEPEE